MFRFIRMITAVFALAAGTVVSVHAQEGVGPQMAMDAAINEDYCGNMGIVKSVSSSQIIIDGMNWDFESESETIEETYVIDPQVGVELDGYASVGDVKEGDFIGIECESRNDTMVATLIQSEEAINKIFEDLEDMGDEDMNQETEGVVEDESADIPTEPAAP